LVNLPFFNKKLAFDLVAGIDENEINTENKEKKNFISD